MASTPKKKAKRKLHFHFKSSAGKSTSYEKPHEKWQGGIIDRTRLVGRSAIDFIGLLSKQQQAQSAGAPNPELVALNKQAHHEKVAAAAARTSRMGRESLRLLGPGAAARAHKELLEKPATLAETIGGDMAAGRTPRDQGHDNAIGGLSPLTNKALRRTLQRERKQRAAQKAQITPGLRMLADAASDDGSAEEDARRGVAMQGSEGELSSDDDEWDTTEWTEEEVGAAVVTLVTEVEQCGGTEGKRRVLATNMLRRLLRKHRSARNEYDGQLQSVMDKAFRTAAYVARSVSAVNLAHMVAALAPELPERVSYLGGAALCTRLLTQEAHLAAKFARRTFDKRSREH